MCGAKSCSFMLAYSPRVPIQPSSTLSKHVSVRGTDFILFFIQKFYICIYLSVLIFMYLYALVIAMFYGMNAGNMCIFKK